MIKVLIVDDSASARTDLKTLIDWDQCGYELIGEANHGIEAIEMINKQLPDLVITDMNMPVMDGVQLIEYIHSHHPSIKTIALSAYDDFDFVRQSLKNGAVDYLLKHQINADTLLQLLQSIKEEIIREQSSLKEADHFPGSKKVLRHEFLSMLLSGSITDPEEIAESLRTLVIPVDMKDLMVAVAEIDDYAFVKERYTSSEQEKLIHTFLDISEEILKEWKGSIIFPVASGQFALIFSLGGINSKMYNYNRIFNVLNRIRSEVKRIMNITASFGVGPHTLSITELPCVFEEAKKVLESKFYRGKNGIYIENVEKLHDGFFCLDIKDEKELYAALYNVDRERVERQIEHIFAQISELRLRSKSTRLVCAELINILNKVCKENGIEVSRLYSVEDVPYIMMEKYETLLDIKKWIQGLFANLLSILEQNRISGHLSKATQMATIYIQENYDRDISLSDAAEYAGVSPSYLSRLFKEECGVGFAEYLNRVRIEKAKWYIEQGKYKLSEVVNRVGYNNYNYFFTVFKKMEGLTPLEYEKRCRHTG